MNIPLTCFDEWADSYGKDWSILALNTKDNVVFKSQGDVERENLYGYFYVSVFKEQVKKFDDIFAGYTADGCRSFYDCKTVVGSDLYKFCANMGIVGTILVGGSNKLVQAIGEQLHDDYGTYYSYFLFVDGSSGLNYSANNKVDDYFDNDSSIKNTGENISDSIKNWFNEDNPLVKTFKIVAGLIAGLLILYIIVKFIAAIINLFRKTRK